MYQLNPLFENVKRRIAQMAAQGIKMKTAAGQAAMRNATYKQNMGRLAAQQFRKGNKAIGDKIVSSTREVLGKAQPVAKSNFRKYALTGLAAGTAGLIGGEAVGIKQSRQRERADQTQQ